MLFVRIQKMLHRHNFRSSSVRIGLQRVAPAKIVYSLTISLLFSVAGFSCFFGWRKEADPPAQPAICPSSCRCRQAGPLAELKLAQSFH